MCRRLSLPLIAVCLLMFTLPLLAEEAAASPQAQEQGKVTAASCARCGDGVCARSCENERTCPADCAPQTKVAAPAAARCGKCGDGQCVASCGETAQTCPRDCGVPSTSATAQCDEAKPKAEAKKE